MLTLKEKKAIETSKKLKQDIRNFILANPTINSEVIALKFKVKKANVGAIKANINKLNGLKVETPTVALSKITATLNKVNTAYEDAKRKGENTYTNHNGENKEIARNKMAAYVVDSDVIGVIPTLPNTEWAIEQKINKQVKGNEFIGVECKEDTFVIMKHNLKNTKLNATTKFGYIKEVLYGQIENTYAHLILDYCGALPTISKEVEYSINNDIVKVGGIIAITFAKPIRGTDTQSEKIKGLAAINNSDERCMSDRSVEAYFNKVTGWNYEVLEFFYYQDTYPMTLVVIKRIK